jgi:hypothetical protein
MDAVQFLSRIVAPGNFLAVCHKAPDRRNMSQRFFPRDDLPAAASYLRWCSNKGMDAWYAVASFVTAAPDGLDGLGVQKYTGPRTQNNTQALRCFWYDADIKRPGDNKTPAQAYADWKELIAWVQSFVATTGLPLPNMWVSSGYGAHLYWVLEDALSSAGWMPYAHAFKAALIASSAKGDVGLTADSARILRPPETLNFKVPASPVPTQVLSKLSRGDYPNDLMLQALQPYMGSAVHKTANYSSAGGLSGAPSSVFAGRQAASPGAAQANMPGARPHNFADIAKTCEQVKQSLANNGAQDSRTLWYLGFMTLAHFCDDGLVYAHEISKGHPGYIASGPPGVEPPSVDGSLQQIANEHAAKGVGAPTCASFDNMRPGVCQTCPHFNSATIKSPYSLGVPATTAAPAVVSDLPAGYRRDNGMIKIEMSDKDGGIWFVNLLIGNVYDPTIDMVGGTYTISFTYENSGKQFPIIVEQPKLIPDIGRLIGIFGPQGIVLYSHNASQFGAFLVAWIEKLRSMRVERPDAIPPFGWVSRPDGTYHGFSAGGTLYRPDGSVEAAPGGDREVLTFYKPRGTIDRWKAACEFVTRDRPDLQVIVAAGFGSPLIEFTGHLGFMMSAWSRDSAVGKSSALLIGTSIWAEPDAMFQPRDTANAIAYRIGQTKVMPAYWDEVQIPLDKAADFVDTLFSIPQGKEKARLNADSTLKHSGNWKTILVTAGNRQLMDFVIQERPDTDAGALRLFEFKLEHPQLPLNTAAAETIADAGKNAGNAGQTYAAWLAANSDTAKSLVTAMQAKVQKVLDATQGERFFVAGIACLLVGSTIANGLGITKFDVPGMMTFLNDAFVKLRMARAKNLPVNNGVFDIERVLAAFVSDHSADRLVTNHFRRRGPQGNNPVFKVLWHPRRTMGRLAIHVGQTNRRMLIDRELWEQWCINHRHSHTETLNQMEARWGASLTRGPLGVGTDYASGNISRIEIPLVAPELDEYIYHEAVAKK